ncbi:MAG: YihY/virulence factor BrkB family protein [Lachnospiraceae bacterium]
MRKIILLWRKFSGEISECHISAYAASAAFFMFLSMIPILLLVCSILPYTPITEADLLEGVAQVFPASLVPIAVSTIVEVYDKSPAIISVSALVTIWSAGKGMLAIIRGLNAIHHTTRQQNYIFQRIRASIYTVILLIMILISLLLGVFGETIGNVLKKRIPEIASVTPLFSNLRILIILAVLALFFTALFTWIPSVKLDWKTQVVGAVFVSVAWSVFSWGFSIYVNNYAGYSIYGSMSTVAMLMLWFYFAFYLMFMGALISKFLEPATEFLLKRHKTIHTEKKYIK